jgi:hypothetical protein
VETVSRNKWTPAEIKYLERYYAWKNVEQIVVGLARITGVTRTKRSVLSKAYKMMLSDSVPEEYSRLAWAHHNHGRRTKTTFLHRLARREGVLRRQPGGHCNPWIVPTKWLEEKIHEINAGAHGYTNDEIRNQWYTSASAAELFGFHPQRFAAKVAHENTILRRIFDAHVRRWRDVQKPGYKYYWHPADTKRAYSLYTEYKRTAATNPTDNLLRNHPKEQSE